MVIFALVIVVMVGMLALAIDIGSVYGKRREMQAMADSLAVAGASEALRNADEPTDATVISLVNAAVNSEATAMGLATSNVTVTTQRNTRDGASSLDITVEARGTYTPHLLRLFGVGSMPVSASATAGSVGVALDECLFAMDPRKEKTIEFKKNSTLSAPSCGVYVAATGKRIDDEGKGASVKIDGNATITAYSFSTVGAISGPNRITITGPTGAPLTQVPVRADPIGGLKRPASAGGSCPAKGDFKPGGTKIGSFDDAGYLKIEKDKTGTIPPGTYCGIEIGEGADISLSQGMYVLRNRGLVIKKKASLVGDKVTFFLTSSTSTAPKGFSPLRLDSEGSNDDEWSEDYKVVLSAPTIADSADYGGILMFQDMTILGRKKNSPGDWGGKLQIRMKDKTTDCGTKNVKDCQTLKLEGVVHIPGMGLVVGKKAGFVGERTLFVARTVKLEDDASMALNASTTTWPDGTPFRRVTLLK